jgi:hypothetical protein
MPEHTAARKVVHVQPLARTRSLRASREPAQAMPAHPRRAANSSNHVSVTLRSWLWLSLFQLAAPPTLQLSQMRIGPDCKHSCYIRLQHQGNDT